jgi:hypothetical protein
VYLHPLQKEIHKRLHAPELGPCACSQVRRLARKLSSLHDTLLSLSQFGTESLQELRALLTSAESAVMNAFTADKEKP